MPELKEQPKNKVTVEDLLKFKRQETPGNDFWDSFDCSMQQKTIKALVQEKPKHRHLAPQLLKWGLGVVPVTGAAVFSLGMFLTKAPVPGIAASDSVDGANIAVVQADTSLNTVAAASVAHREKTIEEFKALASKSSFVMDVLNPLDGEKRYKTVQSVANISIEPSVKTRYSGERLKPSGFTSMLATAPSFDHF